MELTDDQLDMLEAATQGMPRHESAAFDDEMGALEGRGLVRRYPDLDAFVRAEAIDIPAVAGGRNTR